MKELSKKELQEMLESIKKTLNEYSVEFAFDYEATTPSLVNEAIYNFADTSTSIYYSDILDYIKNNINYVSETITALGWEGVGGDLYKAGQTTEYHEIATILFNDLDDIIDYIAIRYILDNDIKVTDAQLQSIEGELSCRVESFLDIIDIIDEELQDNE